MLDVKLVGDMFSRGASSVLVSRGVAKDEAHRVSSAMGKSAALRYDDDEGSFWSNNKSWMVPTLVGLGTFILGDQVGKYGRKDRNAFQNLKDELFRRIRRGTNTAKDNPRYSLSTSSLPTTDASAIGAEIV